MMNISKTNSTLNLTEERQLWAVLPICLPFMVLATALITAGLTQGPKGLILIPFGILIGAVMWWQIMKQRGLKIDKTRNKVVIWWSIFPFSSSKKHSFKNLKSVIISQCTIRNKGGGKGRTEYRFPIDLESLNSQVIEIDSPNNFFTAIIMAKQIAKFMKLKLLDKVTGEARVEIKQGRAIGPFKLPDEEKISRKPLIREPDEIDCKYIDRIFNEIGQPENPSQPPDSHINITNGNDLTSISLPPNYPRASRLLFHVFISVVFALVFIIISAQDHNPWMLLGCPMIILIWWFVLGKLIKYPFRERVYASTKWIKVSSDYLSRGKLFSSIFIMPSAKNILRMPASSTKTYIISTEKLKELVVTKTTRIYTDTPDTIHAATDKEVVEFGASLSLSDLLWLRDYLTYCIVIPPSDE